MTRRSPTRIVALAALAVSAIACLWFWRATLLQMAAAPLVVDGTAEGAKWLWIPAAEFLQEGYSPDSLDRIRDLYREDPTRQVVVVRPAPDRLTRYGVTRPFDDFIRQELVLRGMPAETLVVVPGEARTFDDECRSLDDWRSRQPAQSVCLFCGRLSSGNAALIFRQASGAVRLQQLAICAIADPRYDETDWWTKRLGLQDFMFNWLVRVFRWCHGRDALPADTWDPDEYQRAFDGKAALRDSTGRGTG